MMTNKEYLVNEAILFADGCARHNGRVFAEIQKKKAIRDRNVEATYIWDSALSKMALMDILLPPFWEAPGPKKSQGDIAKVTP